MSRINETQVPFFLFSGLTDDGRLAPFLFIFFTLVYAVTVIGNAGMITLVHTTSSFHTPMYYFLSYLSVVDLCYSSVITPKMLCDLWSRMKSISYNGCALQLFFFAGLAVTEALLLSGMSYDRYAAICHPLHYNSIMTRKKCWGLVLLASSIGFLQSLVQTSCVFSLQYCGSNIIDHFYCDIPPLLKLSCSKTLPCDTVTVFFTCSCGIGSMVLVLTSYSLIVASILRMKSAEGRQKAFSTCSSHIMCISIFYGTVFFIYLRPPTAALEKRDKVVSVFYSVIIPMLNPLIYSLRNQEVKKIMMKVINKSNQ
ncbi:PREDICTED: olfactory receptor 5F1-like [Nanorana parkeri]|uniref:olfactory receptor 5F1-like n=1 Tax=Nanorana parkeri TaxID=125878 RepID=UPI000855009E|nr:PREDICTED: olfactory receptor 5F1-like [Nanorana parkeri]